VGQIHVPVTLRNTREEVLAQLGHLAPGQVHTLDTEALVDTGALCAFNHILAAILRHNAAAPLRRSLLSARPSGRVFIHNLAPSAPERA